MKIKYLNYLLVAGVSAGVGYYTAFLRTNKRYYAGYNEGFDEARGIYKNTTVVEDVRDAELLAMPEEEFEKQPDVVAKAAEAFEAYQPGDAGKPEVELVNVVSAYPEADVKVVEAYHKAAADTVAQLEALSNPVVKKKLLEATSDIPTTPDGRVQYHRISAPEKAEETKTPEKTDEPSQVAFISQQVFVDNESGFKQATFTYYAGDDILSNETDEIVDKEQRESLLGADALWKLKVGSEAMDGLDALYIQNVTLESEFDVVRSPDKYWTVVHNQ